jgi:thiamine biosynthesis lipoprotein
MDTLLSPCRRRLLGAFGGLGALALAGCGERVRSGQAANAPLQFAGETMGTGYLVKLAGTGLSAARLERLAADVHAALDGVDRGMSLYRPDSELMRLNRHAAATPLPLSKDLYAVLAAGQRVAELSQGAFDVSVAPLVHAWGFGTEKRRVVPARGEVLAQRAVVDYRGLRLDAGHRAAVKTHTGLQLDLGGIAKGYGVDLAARALDADGVENYMIEVGGEVRTRGGNAQGRPWQIGIEEPDAVPQRARTVVPLAGRSMATSGDYRIYFEHAGRRYSHEIDPRTAAPIVHGLASVTVVADDCMSADALATALIVLGPQAGWALAQRESLAAYFIVRDADGRLHDRATEAFAALTGAAA